jgi:hypothetical protein
MLYSAIMEEYKADCPVLMGRFKEFSEYIAEYGGKVAGHGVDIGAGPNGVHGKLFKNASQLDGCDI